MNNLAYVEIYGVLVDNITILVELDGSLFGLIRVEVENSEYCFKSNILDVYLHGDDLLHRFISLLQKGTRINLIGELESLQTDLIEYDLYPVIKVNDEKRIIILPNKPVSSRFQQNIQKIKTQPNREINSFKFISNYNEYGSRHNRFG